VFKTALTFVDSVGELWGPLLQGRNILVVPRDVTKDPEQLLHVLEEHKVGTKLLTTPCADQPLLCNKLCIFMSV
jgi:non-ribosomal peptide synthetase component F